MAWILVAVLLAVSFALTAALLVRSRRSIDRDPVPQERAALVQSAAGDELDISQREVDPDLAEVLAMAGTALYIPTDDPTTFLAVAAPEESLERSSSPVPTQMARLAVAGQTAVESMVEAGRLSGRLVMVDKATAEALRNGTLVKDAAGTVLGVIRGNGGRIKSITRLKPLSGSLVRSATAGPAILGAIAAQAQMAQLERSIAEVRDGVADIRSTLRRHHRAEVEARRDSLRDHYRTAMEAGQMSQATWDEIQHLDSLLRDDLKLADQDLASAVAAYADPGLVSRRVTGRFDSFTAPGDVVKTALAEVADARRAFLQFSVLRLWWLSVSEDPALASRQRQLGEYLAGLSDHEKHRIVMSDAVAGAANTTRLQRTLAPRRHKELAPRAEQIVGLLDDLPWSVVDLNRIPALAQRPDSLS